MLEALDRAGAARRAFDALSYTRRKEWARLVESAKTPETRQRRIAKAVGELSGAE
ncbi:MAG TPA: YdeI/OmpD-associated family protein [Asanoa sp.]|nr:YdeI/OmpD-associated family protein [Asanoa sp.]